jgi:TonB family protein
MAHRTRPALTPLALCLFALALPHAFAFAPRAAATQSTAQQRPAAPLYFGDGLTEAQLLYALRSREHEEAALVRLVERRGSSFLPTAEEEKELRAAGATDRLLKALRKNFAPPQRLAIGDGSGAGKGTGFGPGLPGVPGSSGPDDYTRPFKRNEVTRSAVITSKPEPGFTEEARRNNVEGVVRLRAVFDASGRVTNIAVVKGLPDGLTEKAIAAAVQIRFTPAEKDGRTVSQYVVLEYNFSVPLDEKEVDERAIVLEKPEAEYTEEARRAGVRGKVVLKVTLNSYGGVSVDSVEAGLPDGLTESAVAAARRIEFEPARVGDRKVSQRTTVEYVFGP